MSDTRSRSSRPVANPYVCLSHARALGRANDWGGVLFLLSRVLGGAGVYRLRQGKGGAGLLRATMVISLVLVVAYAVAVWAMTGKPS